MRTEQKVKTRLDEIMERRDISGAVKARLKRYVSALRRGQQLTAQEMLFVNSMYKRTDMIKSWFDNDCKKKLKPGTLTKCMRDDD